MNGKCAADYSFTRSAQAGTMASKSSVRVHNDHVQVDPQLTFQRLIFAREIFARDIPNLRNYFATNFAVIQRLYSTSYAR